MFARDFSLLGIKVLMRRARGGPSSIDQLFWCRARGNDASFTVNAITIT
jgi:hypothetical protein